jgi:gluconate kinase
MSRIKIFKTFEEQESNNIEKMRASTPLERFRKLFYMQQISSVFHQGKQKKKTIIIRHGYPTP